jgi:voltage-gated potassium channel Kch
MKRNKVSKTQKTEFTLVIITSLLLIISIIAETSNLITNITALLLLVFISFKIYNMVKSSSALFEDYAALLITIIFWAIYMTLGSNLHGITILAFSIFFIVYGITSVLWAKDLFELRNIMLFLVSYAIFITLIVFIFAGAYYSNNDLFQTQLNPGEPIAYTEAIYFSTITFTTVGYGDIAPLGVNRLIASIQSITAIVLNIAFMGYILASRRFKNPLEPYLKKLINK